MIFLFLERASDKVKFIFIISIIINDLTISYDSPIFLAMIKGEFRQILSDLLVSELEAYRILSVILTLWEGEGSPGTTPWRQRAEPSIYSKGWFPTFNSL